MKRAAWMTEQNPSKWPPAARSAVDMLIAIAEERLQWEAAHAQMNQAAPDGPGAA